MRILAISLDYPPDTLFGSGVVNHDLYTALAQAGHEVTVLTPGRGRGGIVRESSGVTVWETPDHLTRTHLVPADRPGESFGDFDDIQTWNRRCVQWLPTTRPPTPAPEVIHNHGWVTQPIAEHLAEHHRIPIVTTAHVVDRQYAALPGNWPRATDPRYRAAEETSFARSARIILPSRTARDVAALHYPRFSRKLQVVEHGLDWPVGDDRDAMPQRPPGGAVRVLFVGRIGAERSWESFLRAFRAAADAQADLHLRVVGHGPGFDTARRHHRHPAVEFLGKLPRRAVLDELAMADIFCNPALVETFGVAELEAMAQACCVISGIGFGKNTHVDHLATGVAIPVVTGQDGLRFNERQWTRWLLRLARDEHLRSHLGQQARAVARSRHTVERAALGVLTVLQQALSPSAVSRPISHLT